MRYNISASITTTSRHIYNGFIHRDSCDRCECIYELVIHAQCVHCYSNQLNINYVGG